MLGFSGDISCLRLLHFIILFIMGKRTIQKLHLKCHLKPEHIYIWSKISALHTCLYLFHYPISFILFICSLGIKFCFRHHLDVNSETPGQPAIKTSSLRFWDCVVQLRIAVNSQLILKISFCDTNKNLHSQVKFHLSLQIR